RHRQELRLGHGSQAQEAADEHASSGAVPELANDSPEAVAPGGVRDQSPDSADTASIVEAVDDLPRRGWTSWDGKRIGDTALVRLHGLRETIRRMRALTALPLADLVGEAERALGLDIEVLARPGYTPSVARAHLDAFADVAATFSISADRPNLAGFLAWLKAALEEERGLDKGYIEPREGAVQVLTVHAAKGLEWDAVAVPGLTEAAFPAHTGATTTWREGRWCHSEPKDKGWCGGLDGVPYPLRGDADGLPVFRWDAPEDLVGVKQELEQFVLDGGRHAIAEERRLAYVAVTRARRKLLLTAPVWADASTPRLTSRFLTELVEAPEVPVQLGPWAELPEPGDDGKAVNPRQAEPVTATWPAPAPQDQRRTRLLSAQQAVVDAMRARSAGQPGGSREGVGGPPAAQEQGTLPLPGSSSARDEEIEILLRERRRSLERHELTVRLPRHLSASAVVSLARDGERFVEQLRRPMPAPPAVAARRGTAFHAWVEQHYARAAMVDLLDLPGSADEDAGDEDLEVLKEHFLASPWAHRRPEAIEIAVETVIGGVAVRGRIDAVFPRADGGFTIVDWKTGVEPTGDAARVRSIQLGAYRVAFARLRGLPAEQVDGAFYYAASGETVWPLLPDEAELEALLTEAVRHDAS
ncbi:MAG TPA: PD-(D/E)XK nuclease family protein, partial [Segeticoccus sp.]|uniref:PD-(D/E)XK nuclease family protein n=1 Tax=Segeticoccus sp. TaxID=2706531 RepID=UPI002D80FCCB